MCIQSHPNSSWIGGCGIRRLVIVALGVAMLSFCFSCASPTTPTRPEDLRLILTPFTQRGFGTGQVPVVVVTELSDDNFIGQFCVMFKIEYATTANIQVFYFRGKEIPSDYNEFTLNKMEECQKFGRSCLFGMLDKRQREFLLQVDLSGSAGGLLVAELLERDCKEDSRRIAVQTLAIGNSLFRQEKGLADGGSGE